MLRILCVLALLVGLVAFSTASVSATPIPCAIGTPTGVDQTTLTLSGSTAIVDVQWSFCGQGTTAVIHWSNGTTVSGTSAQLGLAPSQCISASADIYNGGEFWTTQAATPSQVCAPSSGGTGGSGSGGGTTPTDTDHDGVPDASDNCPTVANGPLLNPNGWPAQHDADQNGVGDACQTVFPSRGPIGEAFSLDTTTDYCGAKDLRCLASAQSASKCQTGHDTLKAAEFGTGRTVFHQSVAITLCWQPGRAFTGTKGTPTVRDLTCGSLCTYPYKTSDGTVSVNYPNYARAVVTTTWTVSECVLFWGPGCTFSVPVSLTTTYGINASSPGTPPATGTATLYMYKVSSVYTSGI